MLKKKEFAVLNTVNFIDFKHTWVHYNVSLIISDYCDTYIDSGKYTFDFNFVLPGDLLYLVLLIKERTKF